jgi:hypothetical protein
VCRSHRLWRGHCTGTCCSPRGMRLGQCVHSASRSPGSTRNSAAARLRSSASLISICRGGRTSAHTAGGCVEAALADTHPFLLPLPLHCADTSSCCPGVPTAVSPADEAGWSSGDVLAGGTSGGCPSAAGPASAAGCTLSTALLLLAPSRPPYCQSLAMGWPAYCRCTRIWWVRPVFGLYDSSMVGCCLG